MTLVSLEYLEMLLQENLDHLHHSAPTNYVPFQDFITSAPFAQEIGAISDLSFAFEGFHDRYRRLYYNQKLFHEKSREIGTLSHKLTLGAKKSSVAVEDWKRENISFWHKIRGNANELTPSRSEMIKKVISFQIYATAHLTLTDHTTEFLELVQNSNLRVLQYNPDKTFTGKGPNILPRLHVPDVIRVVTKPLEHLQLKCGVDFVYRPFVSERELYTI